MGNTVENKQVHFIKGGTPTKSLATFITASAVEENLESITMRAVGAGAVNQMVKGIITAEGRLMEKGIGITYKMSYKDILTPDGTRVSAIQTSVKFHRIIS